MKKFGKLLLTAAFMVGFCFTAFAATGTAIPEVNVNVTHDTVLSADGFNVTTDTENCRIDKSWYDANTNIFYMYMRANDGFYFSTTKKAEIHINGGNLYKGSRQDHSTTLYLRIAVKDSGTWGEDENGKFFTRPDGTRVNTGWYYMYSEPYDKDGRMQYPVHPYYFSDDGYMLSSCNTPDGYYVGPDGIWRSVVSAGTSDGME